jgi:CHAT domain-containing protein
MASVLPPTPAWLSVLASLAAALAMLAAQAPAAERPTLLLGSAVERQIAIGESHEYGVDAAAGQFIAIGIAQRGMDVSARLLRPDRTVLLSVDLFDDPFRVEPLVIRTDSSGPHTLIVSTARSYGKPGRYRISLEARRPPTGDDEARLEAERVFREGVVERLKGNAGGWKRAVPLLEDAVARFRQLGDRAGEMKALLEKARTEYSLNGPLPRAVLEQAIAMARELGDEPALARGLAALGSLTRVEGDMDTALAHFEESAAISRRLGNDNSLARSLIDIATIHQRRGDPEQTLVMLEQARILARDTGDSRLEAGILNNAGISYRMLGDLDKAATAYEEALGNRRKAGDSDGIYPPLVNLANIYGLRGEFARALALQMEALPLARTLGGRDDEGSALDNIATTYDRMGDFVRALEYRQQALAIRRAASDPRGEAASLVGVGRARRELGQLDDAETALHQALAVHQRLQLRYEERNTLAELSLLEHRRGNVSSALDRLRAGIDLDETLRSQITSPDLRASFRAGPEGLYERLIELLQQQHAANPQAGFDRQALAASERARARVLLDSIIDGRVDLRQHVDPALLARERDLQRRLSAASTQLSSALAKAAGPQAETAASLVNRLTADYQELQAQIRRQSPRYAQATLPSPLSVEQIQRDVLDRETVLLEFALADERSWLWAVTPDALVSAPLPARRAIEDATRAFHTAATARAQRTNEPAAAYARRVRAADAEFDRLRAELARMLLGPVLDRIRTEWKGRRLAIVATGALEYVPFAALGVDDRVLAADHEIVQIPSASVLAVLRQEDTGRVAASRAVAVFADPVFEANDPRLAAAGARPPAGEHASTPTLGAMRVLQRGTLSRLSFSRAEAAAILELAPGAQTLRAVDFDANRRAVLEGALADYRVIHFATHGVFDASSPAWSGLVFSLVDAQGRPQDGFLRLNDIYNMRLNADLVVLSACETAMGRDIRGEGLIGLSRAFMYAGAPRVVASLWQVSDVATAELMKRFYRGLFKEGLRPAAALRAAQLELSRDPRWGAPFYWAGFLLQGDWR